MGSRSTFLSLIELCNSCIDSARRLSETPDIEGDTFIAVLLSSIQGCDTVAAVPVGAVNALVDDAPRGVMTSEFAFGCR